MTGTCGQDGRARGEFAHTIVTIRSDATVRSHLIPEIRRSLARNQPVLMVVGDPIADMVRIVLGTHDAGLEWGDSGAFYTRLGSAFERFRRYLAEQHAAGRHVHVIAEPELADVAATGAAADRTRAYLPYEAMCNEAYAPYGSPVTCIWDARRHSAAVLEEARSVHGHELTEAGRVRNTAYRPPDDYLTGRAEPPLSSVPGRVDHDIVLSGPGDVRVLRNTVSAWAGDHGFRHSVTGELGVAVTEIAANALIHGGNPARARAWHDNGTLIVQVDDPGGRRPPAAAGYRRPAATSATGGRGLWLARQLADTVAIRTGPGHTSVRLHFPYDIVHRGDA